MGRFKFSSQLYKWHLNIQLSYEFSRTSYPQQQDPVCVRAFFYCRHNTTLVFAFLYICLMFYMVHVTEGNKVCIVCIVLNVLSLLFLTVPWVCVIKAFLGHTHLLNHSYIYLRNKETQQTKI